MLLQHIKGRQNTNYKTGRYIRCDGYVFLLRHHHKYANKQGYVYEHRYLVELDLGRYLKPYEVVHHKDKNRSNNGKDNLTLFVSSGEHLKHELKVDMSNRVCLVCNYNNTFIDNKGNPRWFKYQDGFICSNCYQRIIRKRSKC